MKTTLFRLKQIRSEQGSALVITMLLLVVLTIIGVAATHTSYIEILTASASKRRQAAFYAAEAGMEHAVKLLYRRFAEANSVAPNADWDFMLDGSQDKPGGGGKLAAATEWRPTGGVPYLVGEPLPGNEYTYDVLLYNNVDGGIDATDDVDGVIVIRSIGRGVSANGGYAALEKALSCTAAEMIEEEKKGQEGAGTGKNYNTNDADAIDLVAEDGISINTQL
jgi:type IV pilus assembly protein PilX